MNSGLLSATSPIRWLWYAVDHATNIVLAYVFGKRKDGVFKNLKALLEPFGISRYYTNDWALMNITLKPIIIK